MSRPIENPGLSIFAGTPHVPNGFFVECAAIAAALEMSSFVVAVASILAGREGVEPSCASFGDSPDLRITTYAGAIGGNRTRSAALATQQSANDFRSHAAPEGFEPSSLRLTGARTAAIVLQGIARYRSLTSLSSVEVQGIEP